MVRLNHLRVMHRTLFYLLPGIKPTADVVDRIHD